MRVTSTPQHLTDSVCAMALEISSVDDKDQVLQTLGAENKEPSGVHLIHYE